MHPSGPNWGTTAPEGEGRLVPIPPHARALVPLAWLPGLLLLLVAAALATASPAAAAKPCWERVVQDWHEDGRIDGTYPRACYTAALKNLQEDVRVYGSFEEDVNAALQRAGRLDRTTQASGGGTNAAEDPRGRADGPRDGLFKKAFNKLGPREADAMPLPLLILGGLALLLIAAGAAGLISRRLRARRDPSTP